MSSGKLNTDLITFSLLAMFAEGFYSSLNFNCAVFFFFPLELPD